MLTSKNGQYYLLMEASGNLTLWQVGRIPIWWQSNTWSPPSSLNMQTDGNLVIYNYSSPQGVAVWATNTNVPGSSFQVMDTGDMYVWSPSGPVWGFTHPPPPPPQTPPSTQPIYWVAGNVGISLYVIVTNHDPLHAPSGAIAGPFPDRAHAQTWIDGPHGGQQGLRITIG